MTITETETVLTERLTRLASYAPESPTVEFSGLPLARVTEAPRRRAPAWAVAAGVAVAIGGTAISLAAINASNHTNHARTVPAPSADSAHLLTIEVHNFFFSDASHRPTANFNVPAWPTAVQFEGDGSTYDLAFADPTPVQLEGWDHKLSASHRSAKTAFLFVEGHVYTVFCKIPGHRQAGLEATITVGPPAQAK